MDEITKAYAAVGISRTVNDDGTEMLVDQISGLTELLSGQGNDGACPYCGSHAVATHQIGGIFPGDQDSERVCLDCKKSFY